MRVGRLALAFPRYLLVERKSSVAVMESIGRGARREAVIEGMHIKYAVIKYTVVNDCPLMICGRGWDMGSRCSSIPGPMPHAIG